MDGVRTVILSQILTRIRIPKQINVSVTKKKGTDKREEKEPYQLFNRGRNLNTIVPTKTKKSKKVKPSFESARKKIKECD